MRDIVLLAGGNDFDSGQVQAYVRKKGKDVLPPYTKVHPEMAHAKGRFPDDVSCSEEQISEPQLLYANMLVATAMLCYLWTWFHAAAGTAVPDANEVFLRVRGPTSDPVFNGPA